MNTTNAAPFDVHKIRADFPILAKTVYGKPLVYLDNAASAQKPKVVLDRMVYAYENEYANVHRGLHYMANAATEAFEHARETVRAFINAASTDEIIFTRNATEAMNLVAASLGQMVIKPGDEIILSTLEHHANIVPWQLVAQRTGAVIRVIPLNERGDLDLAAYHAMHKE
jgi:cysteine desulfurase/selenocysteine lyase